MTEKFSGIKLKFSGDGECTQIVHGKEQIPHRVDIIQQKMNAREYDALANMFFKFDVPACRNASTIDHIRRERILFDQYCQHTESGIAPDAA